MGNVMKSYLTLKCRQNPSDNSQMPCVLLRCADPETGNLSKLENCGCVQAAKWFTKFSLQPPLRFLLPNWHLRDPPMP